MEEKEENQEKERSLRRVFSRFSEKTTMHAAPYINSATLMVAKVIWSILLVAGIAVMALHLFFLISNFIRWPKKTTLELGFNNLQLPAVTICNVNPILHSSIHNFSPNLQRLVELADPANYYINKKRKKRFLDSFDNQNFSNYDDGDDFEYLEDQYYENDYDYDYVGPSDAIAEMNKRFLELYTDEETDVRENNGHDIYRMLLRCTFGKFSCSPDNFTLFQSPHYGMCYTIDSSRLVVRQPGPGSGLTLMLYLENHEYLPGFTDGYGARVHVHPSNTIPFPYQSGFFIQAAHETTISLKQTQIKRIGKPHGNCATSDEFLRFYNKTYNRQSCLYLCRPTLIMRQCNCYEDLDYEFFKDSNQRECQTKQDYECLYRVSNDFYRKNAPCDCPDPCTETDYTLNIASRQWPTESYSELLKASICEDLPDDCDIISNLTLDKLVKNFAKVVIYYQQLNFQSIKEEPDIENSQFASDVGGAIGLWIGLSILSIFEICQLVVEIIDYFIYGSKKKDKRKQPYRKEHRVRGVHERAPPVYYVHNSAGRADDYRASPSWERSSDTPDVHFYKGSRSAYEESNYSSSSHKEPHYDEPSYKGSAY